SRTGIPAHPERTKMSRKIKNSFLFIVLFTSFGDLNGNIHTISLTICIDSLTIRINNRILNSKKQKNCRSSNIYSRKMIFCLKIDKHKQGVETNSLNL
ncbi:MAG: hypothetical protein Q7U55_06030, partial [Deltaproteobacteria bacterium]|nr:hypothetical protein [Deltaproteobacteria bacterium]